MTVSRSEASPDRLLISGLELRCVMGVERWERLIPQRVIVDIELYGDFSTAAASDELSDAPDYRLVCTRASEVASDGEYRLVEKLADRIAQSALEVHGCITSATVAVHKPLALAGFGDARATVEVTRNRC